MYKAERRKSKRLVTKTRNRLADDRADEANSSINCDGDEREDEDDDVLSTSQEFLSPQPLPDDTDMLESCNNRDWPIILVRCLSGTCVPEYSK